MTGRKDVRGRRLRTCCVWSSQSNPLVVDAAIAEHRNTGSHVVRRSWRWYLNLEGQLQGQLRCLDFGYHIAINGFRGFLVSPRPTIQLFARILQTSLAPARYQSTKI